MKLIIIGNGFDLSNGLKTKYSDFKEWLEKNHRGKYLKVKDTFGLDDDKGNKIENQIAESGPHIERLVDEITKNESWADTYNSDDFSEPGKNDDNVLHAAAEEIEHRLICSEELNTLVMEGIQSLEIPVGINKGIFDKKDIKVINFNYTNYLCGDNVFHIHGSIDEGVIKFGHDNSCPTEEKVSQFGNHMSNSQAIMNSYDKEAESNVALLRKFIKDDKIDRVEIFGLSLGKQDMRYINEFKENNKTYHGFTAEDLKRANEVLGNATFVEAI